MKLMDVLLSSDVKVATWVNLITRLCMPERVEIYAIFKKLLSRARIVFLI
jgi:hypothetical protein